MSAEHALEVAPVAELDPYADVQPGELRFLPGGLYVYRPRQRERLPTDPRLRPVSLQIRCLLMGLLVSHGPQKARQAVELSADAFLSALRGWAMPQTVARLEYWAKARLERVCRDARGSQSPGRPSPTEGNNP